MYGSCRSREYNRGSVPGFTDGSLLQHPLSCAPRMYEPRGLGSAQSRTKPSRLFTPSSPVDTASPGSLLPIHGGWLKSRPRQRISAAHKYLNNPRGLGDLLTVLVCEPGPESAEGLGFQPLPAPQIPKYLHAVRLA